MGAKARKRGSHGNSAENPKKIGWGIIPSQSLNFLHSVSLYYKGHFLMKAYVCPNKL